MGRPIGHKLGELTERERRFVDATVAGLGPKEAAIRAGYTIASAAATGSAVRKKPKIVAAVEARLSRQHQRVDPGTRPLPSEMPADLAPDERRLLGLDKEEAEPILPRTDYTDPKDFLLDVINTVKVGTAARLDAAKNLMPYMHGRVSDIGKKKKAEQRAHEAAGVGEVPQGEPASGGKPKFPIGKAPPHLRAVGSSK